MDNQKMLYVYIMSADRNIMQWTKVSESTDVKAGKGHHLATEINGFSDQIRGRYCHFNIKWCTGESFDVFRL